MNPDLPNDERAALESNLTALLLGELSHEQAAALHQKLAQEAELAKLYDRLKLTINLVRETVASPAADTAEPPAPLKLADERRQKLLAHFKTVKPKEFSPPRQSRSRWLVPMGIAAGLVVILGALLLPTLSKSRGGSEEIAMLRSRAADKLKFTLSAPQPALKRIERYGLDRNGDANRFARQSSVREGVAPAVTPAAGQPPPAKSAGTAIVLPSTGDFSEVGAGEPGKASASGLWNLSVGNGGLDSESAAPSDSARDRGAFGGYGASTVRGVGAAEGRPKADTVKDYFFGQTPSPASPTEQSLYAPQSGTAVGDRVAPGTRAEDGRFQFGLALNRNAKEEPQAAVPALKSSTPAEAIGALDVAGAPAPEPLVPPAATPHSASHELSVAVPAQTANSDSFVAGLTAGGRAGESARVPLQVHNQDGAVQQLGTVWSDASKKPLDRPAAADHLVLDDVATTAGTQERVPSAGPDVSGKPAFPVFAFGSAAPATRPAAAGKAAGTSVNGTKPVEFGTITESPNAHWYYDTGGQPKAVESDGDNRLALGDVPALGRFYRAPENATAGSGAVRGRESAAPVPAEQLKGVFEQLAQVNGPVTDHGKKAGAEKGVALYAGRISGGQANVASAADRKSDVLNAGAFQLNTEEKAKSVDSLVNEGEALKKSLLDSEAELKERSASHLYNLNVVGYVNVPADAKELKTVPAATASPTRSPIVLPGAPAETRLALNYSKYREQQGRQLAESEAQLNLSRRRETEAQSKARTVRADQQSSSGVTLGGAADVAPRKPAAAAPIPQPEVQCAQNAFSTFSLNVSDVSYKLAGATLEKGTMPEPASIRSEEFINAFDYRDPEAPAGVPVAFAWERAQYPFAQNRDLLRFSIKTAALGRQPGRPLNLVLLLDNSGSMERADRVQIIHEALRVLAGQLQPQDKFSVVTFSRTAHLWVDGVAGNKAGEVVDEISGLTPQGGTNLEDAMNLAYQTALRHYLANGVNRVVLLTDGAANLGNVEPEALKQSVEAHRKQGIALDCFGIGWEGYNDDLLEVLSRNGDGRYGFVNTPEEAATEFAGQLAGALHVAASDVKVQVEFNPARVTAYRQIGYAKHQLTKEQFRDNTVDAAEIAAQEAGNALYVVEVNPRGNGPLATVRVRFKVPGTTDYREHEWPVPYTGNAVPLEQASPAMRLAATASAFAEWLAASPYAGEVSPDRLLGYLSGVPEVYGADARPKKLEWMIRQAKSIAGR